MHTCTHTNIIHEKEGILRNITHEKEITLAMRKKEILPFVTIWMDLESIMLSEINQTEKDKYCMVSLIYGI